MTKRYQVLARKYRPQAFRDVVGQEAAVTTLKNAIRFDKVAHAYLFCGSRGVGKTTLARLFAKALNCQSPTPDFEPCNQCPSCLEIASGQSLDVIEIDGASNRGIDDIRQINETVGYAPSHGRFKIYIIDEVHMLTKEAFNALLKTLEEPPEKAKFFFATTEAHKVLPTIISRCQRFDLARIQPNLIASKLQQIALDLSRTVEPEALQLIATFAEGSLRDAESLFDQILCFSEHTITASIVRQSLGLVPKELFLKLDEAFSNYHLPYAFELVDQLFQTGKDLPHFLEQLIEHYRNLILAKMENGPSLYTQAQLLHILDLLINAESTFQRSAFQRIALESLLLQIIRSKNRIPVEVLIRALKSQKVNTELETQIAKLEIEPPQKVNAERETQNAKLEIEPPLFKEPEPLLEEILPVTEPVLIPPLLTSLQPVPFNPYTAQKVNAERETQNANLKIEPAPPVTVPAAPSPSPLPLSPSKHPSHYDTLMRFAAIELEGTVKN